MRRLWIAIGLLISLVLLLPALAASSNGDATLAPQSVVLRNTSTPPPLTAHWNVLRDESAQLQIADVLQRKQQFFPLDKHSFIYPASSQAVWLQVQLPAQQRPSWLWIFAPRVQYLDYYLVQDGRLQKQLHTGELRPFQERPLPSRSYLFALPTDGQPMTLYVRMTSNHPLMAWFEQIDDAGLVALERPAYFFGMLLGAMLLLMLYNLTRFAYMRGSTSSLWLAAMHGSLALCAAANLGLVAFALPWLTFNQSLVADLGALGAAVCLLGFAASFFRGTVNSPLNRLLHAEALAILLIGMLIAFTQVFWFSWLVYLLVILCSLSVPLVAAWHWYHGYRPARLVTIGMLVFNGGFLVFLPVLFGTHQLEPGWLVLGVFSFATLAGFILSVSLTERQRLLQQLNLQQRTSEAAHAAELQAKGDFLAKISHEIRTPMNGVLGMTELLLGTPLSAKQRDYVQTIHSAGNELLSLINEILDISKLESGQIELDEVQFDLGALIEDCLAIFRAKAEQQKVELISFTQPQVPRIVSGDPTRLRQAVLSLLDNAFKQTDEGEILLVVALDGPPERPRLRIAVQDSGRPLDSADRQALLTAELHSRDFLSATRISSRLGLIIARQLIRLMSGDFGIESGIESGQGAEGAGNLLWLSLPLDPQQIDQSGADLDGPLQGARLLVVDDNQTCRKVVVQQCSAWGMNVSAVSSGKEALAQLRTKAHLREYFDVVLLDQDMPGMTGMQLATKIQEDPNINHDLLLIMLTGISNAPSKIIARNAGIKRILAKPVAGYTLKATLAEELSQRGPSGVSNYLSPASEPASNVPPTDFRILVAEDNSISTKVIRGMLSKLNLQPDTASNGEEALAAMKSTQYDLVLMDCEMPVLDGFSATERLRAWEASEQRPHTPVVALTAHILSEHKERARLVGMDGHMAKPVELSQLRELVAYWVGERDRRLRQQSDALPS
ncbi:hybrid sensor histidine kinase/response regulator [Pseudomonas sp. DP-17]|uniref:hybrid sensor histidine kinase/response regulator n=1 Tax=Pseudomonas sp. DP-17 TaxID=1580486 RepID=UPI001EFAF319|nr:response regulator [Pseudomonas sp. DP-17]